MSFFLHLLPSSFIPVPFPTSPFEVSMLCNDLDGQCRPFYLPSYQSPCGDSFHFNEKLAVLQTAISTVSIPLRGFFSFQQGGQQMTLVKISRLYQSPCGDSFHFNVLELRPHLPQLETRINPLAGILFISTRGGSRLSILRRRINPLAGILFISTRFRSR